MLLRNSRPRFAARLRRHDPERLRIHEFATHTRVGLVYRSGSGRDAKPVSSTRRRLTPWLLLNPLIELRVHMKPIHRHRLRSTRLDVLMAMFHVGPADSSTVRPVSARCITSASSIPDLSISPNINILKMKLNPLLMVTDQRLSANADTISDLIDIVDISC